MQGEKEMNEWMDGWMDGAKGEEMGDRIKYNPLCTLNRQRKYKHCHV